MRANCPSERHRRQCARVRTRQIWSQLSIGLSPHSCPAALPSLPRSRATPFVGASRAQPAPSPQVLLCTRALQISALQRRSTVRCRCEKRLPCIKVSLPKPGHREPSEALISGLSWRSESTNQATMLGSYSSRLSPSCDSPLTRHQINS